MPRYMVIHCKHAGCYDFNFIEDKETKTRFIPITINTPKVFMFDGKDEAREFFNEYMNDVDVVDHRCRTSNGIRHLEHCTCGVIDLDDEDHPSLFYNKTNQIFLLEYTAQVFMPNQSVRVDINNMNISNNLMRRCKNLSNEQRKKYIELGRMCEDCNFEKYMEEEKEKKRKEEEEKQLADDKLIEDMKREIEKKLAEEREKQLALNKAKEEEEKEKEEKKEEKKEKKEKKIVKEKVVKEKKDKKDTDKKDTDKKDTDKKDTDKKDTDKKDT